MILNAEWIKFNQSFLAKGEKQTLMGRDKVKLWMAKSDYDKKKTARKARRHLK